MKCDKGAVNAITCCEEWNAMKKNKCTKDEEVNNQIKKLNSLEKFLGPFAMSILEPPY